MNPIKSIKLKKEEELLKIKDNYLKNQILNNNKPSILIEDNLSIKSKRLLAPIEKKTHNLNNILLGKTKLNDNIQSKKEIPKINEANFKKQNTDISLISKLLINIYFLEEESKTNLNESIVESNYNTFDKIERMNEKEELNFYENITFIKKIKRTDKPFENKSNLISTIDTTEDIEKYESIQLLEFQKAVNDFRQRSSNTEEMNETKDNSNDSFDQSFLPINCIKSPCWFCFKLFNVGKTNLNSESFLISNGIFCNNDCKSKYDNYYMTSCSKCDKTINKKSCIILLRKYYCNEACIDKRVESSEKHNNVVEIEDNYDPMDDF